MGVQLAARRRLVALSPRGKRTVAQLETVRDCLRDVASQAIGRCGVDIIDAFDRFEQELRNRL